MWKGKIKQYKRYTGAKKLGGWSRWQTDASGRAEERDIEREEKGRDRG